MAVLTEEEYKQTLKNLVADDNSDDSLKLLEDLTDTYNDLKSKSNDEEWQRKYDELDKQWREKYKARFFDSIDDENENEKDEIEVEEDIKVDDLFKERESE